MKNDKLDQYVKRRLTYKRKDKLRWTNEESEKLIKRQTERKERKGRKNKTKE